MEVDIRLFNADTVHADSTFDGLVSLTYLEISRSSSPSHSFLSNKLADDGESRTSGSSG